MMDIIDKLNEAMQGKTSFGINPVLVDAISEIESLRAKLAQPTPSQSVDERAMFDRFMTNKGYALNYAGDGQYEFLSMQLNWEIWLARAQLSKQQRTPSQSEPVALTKTEQGIIRTALLNSVKVIHPLLSENEQSIPSQSEPVAWMYKSSKATDIVEHKFCEETCKQLPKDCVISPLYTKPQPTSQDAIGKPCICEGGRFIVTGVSINANADEIANITVFDKEKDNLNYLSKSQTKSQDVLERKLTAIVKGLETNQPDVFSRGLWEAIDKAMKESK